MEIPQHLIDYGPWSISKAGMIEKCSQQFFYKHVNKYKELVTFEESRVGVAVHKALEFTLDPNFLSKDSHDVRVKKAFVFVKDQSELTSDEEEQLDTFFDQVTRFTKRMYANHVRQRVHPSNVMIEKKLGVTKNFTRAGFYEDRGMKLRDDPETQPLFRGVIDYAYITGDNDMVIIDHKSGRERELSYYSTQFKAYCVLGLVNFPQIRRFKTAINFTATDKLLPNEIISAEMVRSEYFPWLVEYLTKSCEGLLMPPKTTRSGLCNWCAYKPICPEFGGTGRVDTESN